MRAVTCGFGGAAYRDSRRASPSQRRGQLRRRPPDATSSPSKRNDSRRAGSPNRRVALSRIDVEDGLQRRSTELADHLQHFGGGGLLAPALPCVSLNSRAFWIAITAWSAKVCEQRDLAVASNGDRCAGPRQRWRRWPRSSHSSGATRRPMPTPAGHRRATPTARRRARERIGESASRAASRIASAACRTRRSSGQRDTRPAPLAPRRHRRPRCDHASPSHQE